MRRIIVLLSSLLTGLIGWAQETHIEFFTPSIVHVVKSLDGKLPNSLVVTAKPEEVKVTKRGTTTSSSLLTVKLDERTGALTFLTAKGKVLLREKSCSFNPVTTNDNPGKYRINQTFLLDKDEAIYGLGTIQNGKMNRRGEHKRMEQSNLEDFQNVIQSIKGWGIYWDNYSPTQFDDDENGMSLTSEVGEAVDYYFMYGGSADSVIAQIRHLSGNVPMFPLWTFGYWQSKERYKSANETLGIVQQYRKLSVPLDGIIQDWQYWGSNYLWNAMDFLSEDFSNGRQMIDEVHKLNAHFMISIWASFGPMTKAFRELQEKDLLFDFETWPQSGLTFWPPRKDYPSGVRVYDAFSPEARDIYWKNLKTLFDYDTDAWWMDSTDPDFFDATPANYAHKAGQEGGTWRSLRNAFPLETVRGVYQAQRKESDKKRVFIMTRSSYAGQQHYGSNMWSGDVASSWDMLRKQVPAGLSFSLTGNPNFNTDIGGFFCGSYNTRGGGSAPRNPQFQELYVRWMQYGLFCPVFRSHGADAPREIWQFGKKGEPVYDAIESAIRLRYRLIPYLYSTAWQVTSNNESYLRPLFSDFAQDRLVWDMADEFMFGRSILATPILDPQYTEEKVVREDAMTGWNRKDVGTQKEEERIDFTAMKSAEKYLPKGTDWYDFWTGKRYRGGQSLTLETQFDRVPMFVRAGSILPLGPVMQYVDEKKWDDLELHVYPGADASFTLYEDEGDNYNYEKGAYTTISMKWSERTHTLTIGERKGNYPGMLEKRQFTIITPDGQEKKVEYTGKAINFKL
ncbi:MAG: DUF5110 domain-containing protein [Bacteroidaceae bacterium]|nr:DUF5110 domain-containing protein [Bacteroidaceae bacterium]